MEERVKQDKISCYFPCVLKAIHFKDSSQRKQKKPLKFTFDWFLSELIHSSCIAWL